MAVPMSAHVDTSGVIDLVARGAQLVDVLPAEAYRHEHLPGAISLPLQDIVSALDRLDPARPVITYCFDHQCDLSARAASRLEQLGFDAVYDYADSKAAWLAEGLPSEGLMNDSRRAISRVRRDVPTVPIDAALGDVAKVIDDWELAVVTTRDNVVMGIVRAEASDLDPTVNVADVMQPAPSTVRPSIPREELAANMDRDGHRHLLVTTPDGVLIGLVRRDDLDAV
jgi:rhodanese-related sulfurtransferase/CBS domain-containing protein